MSRVITVGYTEAQKSNYTEICEILMTAAEKCEIERLYYVYMYFNFLSKFVERIGCTPNTITLYPDYTRDVELSKRFENNFSYDGGTIYNFIKEDKLDNYFLFAINFSKPYTYENKTGLYRINDIVDEVLIECCANRKDDGFFITITGLKKTFKIMDYNNRDSYDEIAGFLIEVMKEYYKINEFGYNRNYKSFRFLRF